MPSESVIHVMNDAGSPSADPSPEVPVEPPPPPEQTSVSTLLRAAVADRPLEEVAALVELLRSSGGVSHHGDEALRLAVVDRPVSEVGPLIELLNGTPYATDSGREALRAAALGRSVEDVAQLIAVFGAGGSGGPMRAVDADGAPSPEGEEAPFAGRRRVDPATRDADTTETATLTSHRQVPPRPAGAPPAGSTPAGVPVTWGTASHRTAIRPQNGRQPGHDPSAPLRLMLRWPAGVALAACGLSHLPVIGMSQILQSGRPVDALSLVIAGGFMVLAVLLAVRDTALAWTVSATAAVAVIVLHLVARVGVVNPLRSVLGDAAIPSEVLAVTLAIVSAGLAGTALARRQRRVSATAAGA